MNHIGLQATIQELKVAGGTGTPERALRQTTTFQALKGNKKADLRLGIGLHEELYLSTKSDGKLYRVTDCIK